MMISGSVFNCILLHLFSVWRAHVWPVYIGQGTSGKSQFSPSVR